MMQPCYWDDMKNLDELGLDQNKLGKRKKLKKFLKKKKANLIRRIIQAACFCSKESKKEDPHDIYVAYNPSFRPTS
ncbi:hypothetical protein TNIN_501131 [Trichonephila inaurata madagascariensis]|uniref:Uncharacterized protein n=1 Tax=Trichonephila inaurata madagascariensis TaxID=2747483 RepID=A0A8X6YFZ6_9ARAC|nr:hypothetical protein TNIN_501131 [Trichonephila inaurata madagascariensis]